MNEEEVRKRERKERRGKKENKETRRSALTTDHAPAALAFARIRSDGSGYTGLGAVAAADGIDTHLEKVLRRQADVNDWTDLNRHWSEQLTGLAGEFASGLAVVQPQPGACQWCSLKPLCRIHSAQESSQ